MSDPQSLNAYSYANNNPITLSDPSGLFNTSTGLIEKGDTLSGIAKQINSTYGTSYTYQQLAQINGISNPNKIYAGNYIEFNRPEAVKNSSVKIPTYAAPSANNPYTLSDDIPSSGIPNEEAMDMAISFTPMGAAGTVGKAARGASYKTFEAFKKAVGSAGAGNQWHHIVEQGGKNATQFAGEQLHNLQNVVNVPAKVNQAINGYYNAKSAYEGFRRFRDYIQSLSFDEQYKIGMEILNQFLK